MQIFYASKCSYAVRCRPVYRASRLLALPSDAMRCVNARVGYCIATKTQHVPMYLRHFLDDCSQIWLEFIMLKGSINLHFSEIFGTYTVWSVHVNGKWLPDFIERLKASAWHQLYLPLLPFTHARSESINADSLKLQLLTARKKEWWPATADNLPQAVYLPTVKHTALVGIEPTTFRS